MIEVELLKTEDEDQYSEFLDKCEYSMAQHTLGWRSVIESITRDKSYYFVAKENGDLVGVLSTFIKENALGNIMNSIPFAGGYGGVVTISNIKREKKEKIYKALIQEMICFAKNKQCVLVTITTPPFSRDINLYKVIFKPDYILENFMQYIDLNINLNYNRNVRWSIKKAINKEVYIKEDIQNRDIEQFYKIYKNNVSFLNAKLIPISFFKRVNAYLNTNTKFLFAEYNGQLISGILLIFFNKIVDYFISSNDVNYKSFQANSLLIDYAINWAKKNGFKYWNWQSSPSRESGVYRFKAQWGSLDGEHYYLTKVLGDLTALKKCSVEQIKREYEWYYVIPYNQL